jgi:4-hydroxy-4-methyl-2-oxoglutarate aldolase
MKKLLVPTLLVAKAVGSRPNHECILGDGMAKELYAVGCVGIVTDGGVRDVEGLLTVPFSAHSRGRTIHHTPVRVVSIDRPVEIGGITVSTGEVIHANIGGVIKLNRDYLARLVRAAPQMRAFEHEAHCIFRQTGMELSEKNAAVAKLAEKYNFGA